MSNDIVNKIIILPDGWIVVGQQTEHDQDSDVIRLIDASVLRKWNNGLELLGVVPDCVIKTKR